MRNYAKRPLTIWYKLEPQIGAGSLTFAVAYNVISTLVSLQRIVHLANVGIRENTHSRTQTRFV